MHRTLARLVFVLISGTFAAALGVGAALLYSAPGRRLLVRVFTAEADRLVRGSIAIGGVGGNWIGGFELERVVIRDSAGELLADVPRLEASYRIRDFLSGQIIIGALRLHSPQIQIIKHRNGRLNYEDIFRLGEDSAGSGGPRQLIEIRNLRIDSGTVTIRQRWNPDGRLRTLTQIDSALAFERAKPGRRIEDGPEGLDLVRTISDLNTEIPLLRLSSPDDAPTLVRFERLAARISDPGVQITDLKAELHTKNDSLVFTVERAELPRTLLAGQGRLDWPRDTILYRFGLEASRLALADLRWISPGFPDFTGRGTVQARSVSGARTEYDIRDLAVGDAGSRVSGRLVAMTDIYRGLGFRRLALDLGNLDLDVVRPYLDSVPFYGKITGRLAADGFFDGMTVSLDWHFRDAMVEGGAESRLGLDGRLRLGGAEGMIFEGARVSNTDVDLRTVRLVSPAVILEGRLGLDGSLTGPWKNVVFEGSAEHRDEDRPPSRLAGTIRLDTRAPVLGLDADVVLDSLSFDGIRRTFPTMELQGSLGGPVKLGGTLERLAVDADVGGAIGNIRAFGTATVLPPRWGADSLVVIFSGVNLAAMSRAAPVTVLAGTMHMTGTVDSAVAPSGRVALTLAAGRIREFPLDSATALVRAADSLIILDTLRAAFAGGRVDGSGSIGWTPPKTGRMTIRAEARDLAPFDSLALALTGFSRDTTRDDAVMEGTATGSVTLDGALGALDVNAAVHVQPFRWLAYWATNLRGELHWAGADSGMRATAGADTLIVRKFVFTDVHASAQGRADSLHWSGSLVGRDSARVAGGGRLETEGAVRLFHADSLNIDVLGREWRLAAPLDARISDSLISLDTARLVTRDGSGSVEARGDLSRGAESDLSITALGVELREIYGLIQRDTGGIQGTVNLDARVSGSSRVPQFRGSGALTGGVFGDFQAPLVRSVFDYRDQVLQSNLTFWRTGVPVVELTATLPLDLAFGKVARRQLPGPLTIVARGDSVDLGIVEAFTPNLRRALGSLSMDVRVEGSWDEPRLAGQMRFLEGGAFVPALGVRYGPVSGGFRFVGDSIVAENVRVQGEEGSLDVAGSIRLERLTRPVLGLTLIAREFNLIDVPDYMKIQATGNVSLTGPLLRPVLTGRGQLTNSVIYFADLVTKELVNLDDPLNRDLVDTVAIRRQGLGANFQSRFLDSLTIRDLDFTVGESVWLRSNEANFQLEGRLRVNKIRKVYRMDGALSTPRGTYVFEIGPIRRIFTVERGAVRYFGDLNAELDVQARHVLRSAQSGAGDVAVIAHITGTLEVPRLQLRTPPDQPPRSEPELISLLVLGTSDPRAGSGLDAPGFAAAYAINLLSGELQRALMSETGALDMVEIRPGVNYSLAGNVTSATQIAVGTAIGSKLFVTANAGFCLNSREGAFSPRNLGASLEYRFVRELRLVLSAEPVQACFSTATAGFTPRRYQFGAELRWDRDY